MTTTKSKYSDVERLLVEHDMRPTANRLLVLSEVCDMEGAFSLADMEIALGSVERSSLFRTLELFAQNGLLHTDNAGGTKLYCRCDCADHLHHPHHHAHFTCRICGRTSCFKDIAVPAMELPEGFKTERISLTIQGVCASCASKGF